MIAVDIFCDHQNESPRVLRKFWKDYGSFIVVGQGCYGRPITLPPNPCLCATWQGLITSALVADNSCIFVWKSKRKYSRLLGFTNLMCLTSNYIMEYSLAS